MYCFVVRIWLKREMCCWPPISACLGVESSVYVLHYDCRWCLNWTICSRVQVLGPEHDRTSSLSLDSVATVSAV